MAYQHKLGTCRFHLQDLGGVKNAVKFVYASRALEGLRCNKAGFLPRGTRFDGIAGIHSICTGCHIRLPDMQYQLALYEGSE